MSSQCSPLESRKRITTKNTGIQPQNYKPATLEKGLRCHWEVAGFGLIETGAGHPQPLNKGRFARPMNSILWRYQDYIGAILKVVKFKTLTPKSSEYIRGLRSGWGISSHLSPQAVRGSAFRPCPSTWRAAIEL